MMQDKKILAMDDANIPGSGPSRRRLLAAMAAAGSLGMLDLLSLNRASASVAANVHNTKPRVTPLGTTPLPDMPGKEVLLLVVDYPPGGADPIHRHDAHGFIYVLEGSIVMGVAGSEPITLHPGQTFYESPTDIHTIGRNASKTKPAKFLVFLLKNQNTPPVIPVS